MMHILLGGVVGALIGGAGMGYFGGVAYYGDPLMTKTSASFGAIIGGVIGGALGALL